MPWLLASGRGERCNVCQDIIAPGQPMWLSERITVVEIFWCARDSASAGRDVPADVAALPTHTPRRPQAPPISFDADEVGQSFPAFGRALRRRELDTAEQERKQPTRFVRPALPPRVIDDI